MDGQAELAWVAVYVPRRSPVPAPNGLGVLYSCFADRVRPERYTYIHTYIHTEPFIWRTASTVHVESEALEAVARRPTIVEVISF